jgi:hypothetical protein
MSSTSTFRSYAPKCRRHPPSSIFRTDAEITVHQRADSANHARYWIRAAQGPELLKRNMPYESNAGL